MKKKVLAWLLSICMVLTMMPLILGGAAYAAEENVAKVGETEYATLQAAMNACVTGDNTITLLSDSAEVFTFAQKSGVNITIDGDGNTFSGKITLNAGGGNLTFTDAKIAPANSQTIYLNASTAPNITFDGCTLQGTNKSGTIVYGYASSTSNSINVKNCTADNLQYIVSMRQTGSKSVLIEKVTATNMVYLARTLKCPSVTLKDVTCEAAIGINIKNDASGGKLTLENVNINVVTYNGTVYYPVSGSGAGASWTVEVKGVNTFTANGVPYEGNEWFSGNAGYSISLEEDATINAGLRGTWGGIDWTLTSDGTLTIAPTKGTPVADLNCGKTYEVGEWREAVRYNSKGEGVAIEGWPYDRTKVKKLVIEEGVTSIGSFAAQGLTNLTGEVVIPSTVTYIGQEAFQKSTFTKLTFAADGNEELCIAQGAFKNLPIEEVALPDDRPVHIHAWIFNNCHNLKSAYLPASLVSVHGTNHIDYFKDFNAHSNPTWTKSSEIFAYDENLETITFGSDAVRDMFFANNNGTSKDYIVAYAGLVAYSDLQEGINLSSNEEPLTLIKNITLSETVNVSENKKAALALNDKTIKAKVEGTAIFNLEKGAELKAPEGLDVTTSVEGSKVKYENRVYSVVQKVYVAQVGEVKYESLKEAIEACSNGETVKLLTDITYEVNDVVNAVGGATGFGEYPNPCIIGIGGTKGATDDEQHQPSNVNAVVDLNGYTITNNADAYLFMVMDNAKLTFKDSSEKQTGKIVGNTEAPVIWSTGTDTVVTIDNGSYIAADENYGSLMWATHSGDLVINGGEFKTNATDASSLIMRNEKDRKNSKFFVSGKSTVIVKGGTFYGFNPSETLDDSKDPAFEFDAVAEGYVSVELGEPDVWTVIPADVVAVNEATGTMYDDATEALGTAVAGQTVKLLKDYDESSEAAVIIKSGVTFNLNGKSLKVASLLSFGNVIDTADVAGGLEVSNDRTQAFVQLQPNNTYLPIYDTNTGAYKFFAYKLKAMTYKDSDDKGRMITRIQLDDQAYKVLAETADSGLTLGTLINWRGLPAPVDYTFADSDVKDYAQAEYDSPKNKMITLSIYGLSKLETGTKLLLNPYVKTDCGVVTSIGDFEI